LIYDFVSVGRIGQDSRVDHWVWATTIEIADVAEEPVAVDAVRRNDVPCLCLLFLFCLGGALLLGAQGPFGLLDPLLSFDVEFEVLLDRLEV